MAVKVLKTRIQLKYDTLANWSSANPILNQGEVAVVEVPSNGTNPSGIVKTPPSILLKVGDGTTRFNSLPYITSLAGDVYSWAKGTTAPTNTVYRLVKKNSNSNELFVVALQIELNSSGNTDDFTVTPEWNSTTSKWVDTYGNEWTQIGSATSAGLTYTFAEGSTNGAFTVTPSNGSAQTVNIHGLQGAAYEPVAQVISQSDTGLTRSSQVYTYVEDRIASIDGLSIVVAWKGDSTPVVANIPQGVVVEYGGTEYTGTLAPSAQTVRKLYLVYNNNGVQDVYDEYLTVRSGTSPSYTYTWEKIGDTGIDLSNYVTQSDLTDTINALDGSAVAGGVNSDGTADILTEVAEKDGVVQDVSLSNTSWTFNNNTEIPVKSVYKDKLFVLNFSSGGISYRALKFTESSSAYLSIWYCTNADGTGATEAFNWGTGWAVSTVINITNGNDVANGDLFTLLNTYATTSSSDISKKIRLQKIAVTGNVNDVIQYDGDYLVLDCGTATTVI